MLHASSIDLILPSRDFLGVGMTNSGFVCRYQCSLRHHGRVLVKSHYEEIFTLIIQYWNQNPGNLCRLFHFNISPNGIVLSLIMGFVFPNFCHIYSGPSGPGCSHPAGGALDKYTFVKIGLTTDPTPAFYLLGIWIVL